MGARQRTHRRTALVAALFAVCALGSVPAVAQVGIGPDISVPLPLGDGNEGSSPESTTTTTPPPTTAPTTVATTAPAPATVSSPSAPKDGTPTETSRRSTVSRNRRSSSPTSPSTGPGPSYDIAPVVEDKPVVARLRQVSLPAARQFGFPLALALLVLAFLAVQGRLDARDPKLAAAPLSVDDDLLPFT